MTQITPSNQFTKFGKNLQDYQSQSCASRASYSLNKIYQSFMESFPKGEDFFEAFKRKYSVTLLSGYSAQESLIYTTRIFRQIFPEIKVESQAYGFQIAHSKENPFTTQWNLIKEGVLSKYDYQIQVQEKLLNLLSDPDLDKLKVLLNAKAEISSEVAQQALVHTDPKYFELFKSYGYQPTSYDLVFLFESEGFEGKSARIQELFDLGVRFPIEIFQIVFPDIQAIRHLLSYQYQPTLDDFTRISQLGNAQKILSILKLIRHFGYFFSKNEIKTILFTNSFPRELVQFFCSEGLITSDFFQQFPNVAHSFLAGGYKPTFEDLVKVNCDVDEKVIEEMVRSIASSNSVTTEDVMHLLPYYDGRCKIEKKPLTSELIFKAIELNADLKNLVKGNSAVSTPYSKRGEGPYTITSQDIATALEKKVDAKIFDFLLCSFSYIPLQDHFQFFLKNNPSDAYLRAFIEAGYKVQSSDFQYACEINSSPEMLSMLLNYGMILHRQEVNSGDYARPTYTIAAHDVFYSDKAGYIPSNADLNFARDAGYKEEVLNMIAACIGREKCRYKYYPYNRYYTKTPQFRYIF